MKCHLAITPNGHHITTDAAVKIGPKDWSCIHCSCEFTLHVGSKQESARFEYDQRNVANKALMKCSYLAPRGKDDCRQRKLRFMLAELVSAPLFFSGTAFYVKMIAIEKILRDLWCCDPSFYLKQFPAKNCS